MATGDPLITLVVDGSPLDVQVATHLAADTDPVAGLVPALGQRSDDTGARSGANSIYPNFTTDGPSDERDLCPVPFVIVAPGGVRAVDKLAREVRVIVEVHDTEDMGRLRWPGIVKRLKQTLTRNGWLPTPDSEWFYQGGLAFEDESPPGMHDDRYNTSVVQMIFTVRAQDVTSGGGINR
jgi:hypothetical protein